MKKTIAIIILTALLVGSLAANIWQHSHKGHICSYCNDPSCVFDCEESREWLEVQGLSLAGLA